MCQECGCGQTSGNTRLQFITTGYTEDNAKAVEKELLGMAGVMYVHIHTHDGETTIDYDPKKTKLTEIMQAFSRHDLNAAL